MKAFILLLAASLFAQSGGQTVNVPIVNHSFESHPAPLPFNETVGSTICGTIGWSNIPGWNFPAGTMVYQPDLSSPPTYPCYNTQPPDGSAVLLSDGIVTQNLGITASSLQSLANGQDGDGVYVMKFWVANFYNAYPGYFDVQLLIGTHELCSTDGWGTRNWKEVTLVCPSPSYVVYDEWPPPANNPAVPANPNDHLIISLQASGWSLMFDNVSLTFTPVN